MLSYFSLLLSTEVAQQIALPNEQPTTVWRHTHLPQREQRMCDKMISNTL